MDQLLHLQNNKKALDLRFQILRLVREFFWSQNFVEVETPLLLKLPGQEPYLSPMKLSLHNEKGESFQGFLHTSPEYTMKKMLASGYEKIFSLCKVFRDYESFGGTHNPEFTMVEWYRTNEEFTAIMDDVEALFQFIALALPLSGGAGGGLSDSDVVRGPHLTSPDRGGNVLFERVHMRDLWKEYVGVNLDEYLETEKMFELCNKRGFAPAKNEPFEDLFYRIFLNEIEPKLVDRGGVMVHHYPASLAALSRISKSDPLYAERFEVYVHGLEMANAFGELTDPNEQRKRLVEERDVRAKLGKDVYEIDEEFIEAVGTMPECSGIALGIDRLAAYFAACQNIDSVIALPANKLF